jgi:hypothetical protein
MNIKYLFLAVVLFASSQVEAQNKKSTEAMYKHVVIFKFKETSSKASVDTVVNAFVALKDQIPVVKGFEWGVNVSPEHFDQGFTHCFVLTFANTDDRDKIYQVHPAHKNFQKILGPHMDKVFVVDYKVEK